jgi:hypothetical protein
MKWAQAWKVRAEDLNGEYQASSLEAQEAGTNCVQHNQIGVLASPVTSRAVS